MVEPRFTGLSAPIRTEQVEVPEEAFGYSLRISLWGLLLFPLLVAMVSQLISAMVEMGVLEDQE